MGSGQQALLAVAKEIEQLAETNPCKANDDALGMIASSIKLLIRTKVKTEVSREKASRLLGISTRTFHRKVKSGEIPQGHRDGHKELSWFVDDIL